MTATLSVRSGPNGWSAALPPGFPPGRPAGRYERLAYERQAYDLALAYPPNGAVPAEPRRTKHPRGLWFDPIAAERPIRFIEGFCRHYEGEWAGRPLVLSWWQKFVRRCVFGWKRADGLRRFRIAYQEVPRKSGKSTAAAGDANYLTFGDNEPGAQVYASATKEEQAKIVWSGARRMIKASPDLLRFATLRQKAILCDRLGSLCKPLGSDSDTQDGLNTHGHICDELHAHKDRGMWDVILTSMAARRQPLTSVITTAGKFNPHSIGWEQHDHAVKVLEGFTGAYEDDEFFAIIFAADNERKAVQPDGSLVIIPADDWTKPETWAKANPNLGISVKEDALASAARRAQQQPSFLNSFLRLHLNVWTNQVERWIPLELWERSDAALTRAEYEARERELAGQVCFGGLDLSQRLDLTAFVLFFPETKDIICRFYCPENRVQKRADTDRVPYPDWVRDGWLIATPGDVVDYEYIKRDIRELAGRYAIQQIGFDPYNATATATELAREFGDEFMVEVRQGFASLSEPSKEFEKLVTQGVIRHGNHPVMTWNVGNVAIRRDENDNVRPDKKRSAERIDGVVAAIMAIARALVAPEAGGDSWLLFTLAPGSA